MPLTLYKRGKIWHYRGTVAGRRLRGSTCTQSKAVAERIIADKEARQWKGHLDGPSAVLTFAQAAMIYRKDRKSDRFLKKVEDYWQNTLVRDITAGAVHAAGYVLYPTAGPASWNRQVIVPTQAVINHAAKRQLCPRLTIERFKIARKEKPHATWEWVRAFMDQANSDRVAALPCLLFLTGARISEALRLTWDDVDLPGRRVLITMGKTGGDQRWAHMPKPLFEAIANMDGGRNGSLFGFRNRSNCWTQWRSAIRRAGIAPLGYHACRHGFATTLMHQGVDVKTVAKLGGWKTPALVLSTYSHAREDATLTELLTDTPATQTTEKKRNIR